MGKRFYYRKGVGKKCFMCDSTATTGDHIPPQGFFTTSLRKQNDYKPLKVPACKNHNDYSKKDDQYIRLIFATGSPNNPNAKKLFDERILPRAKKENRNKLMANIYKQMEPTLIANPSGIITIGYTFEIYKERLQVVVEKIVHGIYWHHNGRRIPKEYKVGNYYFNREIPEEEKNNIAALPIQSVGHHSVFEYRYIEIEDNKNKVYIAMLFFQSLFSRGHD